MPTAVCTSEPPFSATLGSLSEIKVKITRQLLRELIMESLITEAVSAPPPNEVKGAQLMRGPGQYWANGEVRRYVESVWDGMSDEQKDLQWADLERK